MKGSRADLKRSEAPGAQSSFDPAWKIQQRNFKVYQLEKTAEKAFFFFLLSGAHVFQGVERRSNL